MEVDKQRALVRAVAMRKKEKGEESEGEGGGVLVSPLGCWKKGAQEEG